MAKYRLPSSDETETIRFLSSRLDERQLRTLLRPEDMTLGNPERTRIVSRRRLGNLLGGSGRLTDSEAKRLQLLRTNVQSIQALSKRGEKEGRKPFQVNRAIRSWIDHGRPPRTPRRDKGPDELRAIRALRFLGVDTDDGLFYVKGRA